MNINQSLWKAIEEAPMIRLRCKGGWLQQSRFACLPGAGWRWI